MFRLNCFTPCIKYKNPKIYKSILKIKKLPKNKNKIKKTLFYCYDKKINYFKIFCVKNIFIKLKKMFCKIQLQLQLIFKCKYYLNITFIFV